MPKGERHQGACATAGAQQVPLFTPTNGTSASDACLFGQARAGSCSALGALLESSRAYLLLVANKELPSEIRQKSGASDLVQESLAEALRAFPSFLGNDERELLLWLRRILLNNVADTKLHFRGAAKRDVGREVPLAMLDAFTERPYDLVDGHSSPSCQAMRAETQQIVEQALTRLPEHYRQVIVLRNLQSRPFAEIGRAMGLAEDTARKLWKRAVKRLALDMEIVDAASVTQRE